jgi:hypothetical protein
MINQFNSNLLSNVGESLKAEMAVDAIRLKLVFDRKHIISIKVTPVIFVKYFFDFKINLHCHLSRV